MEINDETNTGTNPGAQGRPGSKYQKMNRIEYEIPEDVAAIMTHLEEKGYEAYLVGGCVRDMQIGRVPSDYDITTNASPEEIEAAFSGERTLDIGRKHGTITVVRNGTGYEITTYRVDGKYSDHRRPDTVRFTRSLTEDLKRRDFTVNAMAMDLRGEIIGVAHSREDLTNGVIRAVGDPDRRFEEDALRILRGLRFAAQLTYTVEEETAASLHRNRNLLRDISAERIRAELDKILVAPNGVPILREFRDVFAVVLPELEPGFDFDQQNPFHCYDVYEHILHAVEQTPPDIVIRLAALFHDVGKPACFIVKDGWGHFYGHEGVSAEMADQAMRRLRYDNRTRQDVTELIRVHGTVFQLSEKYARRKLNQLGEAQLYRLIALERADVSAQAEAVRRDRIAQIDVFRGIVGNVLAEEACFGRKDLAVNGNDLREAGIPQGPEIGRILQKLLDAVIDGAIPNDREALLQAAREFGQRDAEICSTIP